MDRVHSNRDMYSSEQIVREGRGLREKETSQLVKSKKWQMINQLKMTRMNLPKKQWWKNGINIWVISYPMICLQSCSIQDKRFQFMKMLMMNQFISEEPISLMQDPVPKRMTALLTSLFWIQTIKLFIADVATKKVYLDLTQRWLDNIPLYFRIWKISRMQSRSHSLSIQERKKRKLRN